MLLAGGAETALEPPPPNTPDQGLIDNSLIWLLHLPRSHRGQKRSSLFENCSGKRWRPEIQWRGLSLWGLLVFAGASVVRRNGWLPEGAVCRFHFGENPHLVGESAARREIVGMGGKRAGGMIMAGQGFGKEELPKAQTAAIGRSRRAGAVQEVSCGYSEATPTGEMKGRLMR